MDVLSEPFVTLERPGKFGGIPVNVKSPSIKAVQARMGVLQKEMLRVQTNRVSLPPAKELLPPQIKRITALPPPTRRDG